MLSKVHGRFAKWTGTIEMDEASVSRSFVHVEEALRIAHSVRRS